MGGKLSVDFLAPSGRGGEHARHLRERRLRGRPRDRAARCRARADLPAPLDAPEEIETPGVTTIDALAEFLGIDPAATSKAMPVVEGGRHARARAHPRRRPAQRVEALRRARPARSRARDRRGDPQGVRRGRRVARPGRLRGRGDRRRDAARGQFVAGREPRRLAPARGRGGPRLRAALRRHPRAARGRPLPRLRRRAAASGRRSRSVTSSTSAPSTPAPLGATFLDEDGQEKPILGGSYGIGPGRVMAAAIEQRHDEHGIMLAARDRARTTCTSSRSRGAEEPGRRGGAAAPRGRGRRAARRPRPAARREVRRRRPDRLPDPRHRRQEDPRRRRGRRARPRDGRGAARRRSPSSARIL